ncbi:MAG: hypothetical protein ABW321_35430 [Polyangiales bacterium]
MDLTFSVAYLVWNASAQVRNTVETARAYGHAALVTLSGSPEPRRSLLPKARMTH